MLRSWVQFLLVAPFYKLLGTYSMKTFTEFLTLNESKYAKLDKVIASAVSKKYIEQSQAKKLTDIVIDEYLDMDEDPNSASLKDVVEIIDASF